MARTNTKFKKSYSPVMCQRLINFMSQGGTMAGFMRSENLHPQTYKDWVNSYSEFKEAYEFAKIAKRAWSEDRLREAPYESVKNMEAYKAMIRYVHGLKDEEPTNITIQTDQKIDDKFAEDLQKFEQKRWSEF